jgi:hypothetical protein
MFFGGPFCFYLRVTMYLFLYNLHLLDRGSREDSLGLIISFMNIGSIGHK